MYYAVQQQLLYSERTEFLKQHQIRNARLLTHQAKQKHFFEADLATAEILIQYALKVNSYYIPAWLSLAELYNDKGDENRAGEILAYVAQLTQEVKRWRWEKTLTAYQLGITEMLPEELHYIIREIPGKSRNDALQLAFTHWKDPETILENVGQENLIHLFNFCIKEKNATAALYYWRVIEATGEKWERRELLNFIEMLMSAGEVAEAAAVWRKQIDPDTLFYNGNFSNEILRKAFGWRLAKDKDVALQLMPDEGGGKSKVVEVRFKGWNNINYHHLFQVVPLEGNARYRLTGSLKSRKLTTNERPFLEVDGYKCNSTPIKSEMVEADQEWKEFEVEFGVSQECSAMVVRIRRNETRHLDNKISGRLWIKDFKIEKIDENYTILDEPLE